MSTLCDIRFLAYLLLFCFKLTIRSSDIKEESNEQDKSEDSGESDEYEE